MLNDVDFLDIINSSRSEKDILDILESNDLSCVSEIVINEGLLINRFLHNYDSVSNLLTRYGAKKEFATFATTNKGSDRFKKENPNFWRSSSCFCEKDKFLTKKLLEELGHPEKNIAPVIHITGSNGKGSTATFIENILMENGYKVNKFTNPAVIRNNENITLNGQDIEDEEYYQLMKEVKLVYDKLMDNAEFRDKMEEIFEEDFRSKRILYKKNYMLVPGWSFIIPLLMLSFQKHKADVNIIEVINGGWKDFTNIFTENEILAVVITYTQYGIGSNDGTMKIQNEDGEWICSNEATAFHKAMLSRKGKPVIIANQTHDVLETMRKVVENSGGYTVEYDKDWFIRHKTDTDFVFEGFGKKLKINKSKTLLEDYQITNIATAIATIFSQNKLKIDDNTIQRAVDKTYVPGRLSFVNDGYYKKYLKNCNNIISGYIKFNKSAIDSIENIISKLRGNIYILYTTNNPKTEGENIDFFNVIRKYKNIKLIIYKKSQKTYDFLLAEADKSGIKYATAKYLSLALVKL
ncbi:MAG: hypothetical protein LBG48_01935, partial [Rickettsiales bacterium]|nr:hypothetical protein [Rickettsiales bacterium]